MLIYLDSKDHIELSEHLAIDVRSDFETTLCRGSHRLVFSLNNVLECCAPIVDRRRTVSVLRALRYLQSLPHVYIANCKIPMLALQAAVKAFTCGREYGMINPFVNRFDQVVSPFEAPPTRIYLHYTMENAIRDLFLVDATLFQPYTAEAMRLREVRTLDRSRSDYRQHHSNFKQTVARDLNLYRISFPRDSVDALAAWIWESPIRCPALRLGYEVYHKILRNVGDPGEDSDIPDFSHVDCAPYVDLITLDRRIRGYVRQVDDSIGTCYTQKIRRGIEDIKQTLDSEG
jgi:hypothetical protein